MNSAQNENITFPGHAGGMLAARLERPGGAPKAYALFAHCFTCSKDVFAASRIATALTQHGIAVLRFDFTGLGASEGEFANTNFSSNVQDLLAAADWLRTYHDAPQILIGHSLGGAAVLAAAGEMPEVRAIATIGAPCDPAHVTHLFQNEKPEIDEKGEAEVKIGGRSFHIKKQFLDDVSEQNMETALANLNRALLIFHAPRDAIVGIENAAHIFQAAKHPKSFVSLDDADHLLSRPEDAAYVAAVLAAWVDRYVENTPVTGSDDAVIAEPGTIVVGENGQGPYAQTVSIGGVHTLAADEPKDLGGNDTGPSPYDFLMAALGACTSMTLRMYADRKGWPLEGVRVTLAHEKIHAEDCSSCETKVGKIDVIERVIEMTGGLDEAQRARLLEIANKCPVHRTLHSEVVVETRVEK